MKKIYGTLIALLCITALPAADLSARHGNKNKRAYISNQEADALVKSGHLIPSGSSWKTRGGMILAGRGSGKKSRLDHIMRHTVDIPGRARHGVFSLSKAAVIELLDESWGKVRAGSIPGRERGGKIAYTIRFGKDIGYMGGKEGKNRGNPKLRSIRLVIKKGTAEVVTFFPL